jgi:hypothetical protein
MPDPTDAVKAAIAAAAREAEAAPVQLKTTTPTKKAAAPAQAAVARPVPAAADFMESPAPRAPQPKPATLAVTPPAKRSRGLLVATAAAVLVAAGFLALPTDQAGSFAEATKLPLSADTGLQAAGSVELANGIVLQTIETANGARALVSVLPAGVTTDLQIGDVLLVYAATGEVMESAEAVSALLERETANGIATFGFAVQRDGKMAVGYIDLPRLGQLEPDVKEQDGENKT